MPTSSRVRADDGGSWHEGYWVYQVGARWRVYEDGSEYSSTSGLTSLHGRVMRDTDNRIIQFCTKAQAEAWIDAGCLVSMD